MYLNRSLCAKHAWEQFQSVMQEYFDLGHAESMPFEDLNKPENEVFYLPLMSCSKHLVRTTKLRAVFDASVKSPTGVSLNDKLTVGLTVHSSLIDVLLRF